MLKRLRNLLKYLSPREFFKFWKSLFRKRKIVIQMVKKDFQHQFLGSLLGIFWAFVQPLVFVLVLWFVFAMGFRQAKAVEPVPFVVWLMTGMFCWFFISDAIVSSTSAILQNSYLVRKIKFQVNMLPLVKILSALIVHVVFILLLFVLYAVSGHWPNLYWLQVFYYLTAAIFLTLGFSWITSSLNVFARDITQVIQIMVRMGFWFTPIFWKPDQMPDTVQFLVKLNPAYYLVQGYRDSLIYQVWFWQRPYLTLYFWTFSLLVFVTGALVFKRLRPHFADVL
jgi:ABC-type polysaccharide/polyol phosphate export permease